MGVSLPLEATLFELLSVAALIDFFLRMGVCATNEVFSRVFLVLGAGL